MDYFAGHVPSKSSKNSNSSNCGGNTAKHLYKSGGTAWLQELILKWSRTVSKLFAMKRKSAVDFQCQKILDSEAIIWFLSLKKNEQKGLISLLVERNFMDILFFFLMLFLLQIRLSMKNQGFVQQRTQQYWVTMTLEREPWTSERRPPQEIGCRQTHLSGMPRSHFLTFLHLYIQCL